VHKYGVAETVDSSEKVPRFDVTMLDCALNGSFNRFAFGLKRAVLRRAHLLPSYSCVLVQRNDRGG
jgi:hypothetical protein